MLYNNRVEYTYDISINALTGCYDNIKYKVNEVTLFVFASICKIGAKAAEENIVFDKFKTDSKLLLNISI